MSLVTQIVKYNNQTTGREKLCRLVQYTSKFAKWYVTTSKGSEDLVNRLKLLENALSSSRKVMRFGKSLDMFQGALKSMSLSDYLLRTCLVCAKLTQACYLLVDHYVWMGKTGLINIDSKVWGPRAARFWLTAIIFNLLRDLYDIVTVLDNARRNEKRKSPNDSPGGSTAVPLHALLSNKPLMIDVVKNVCDIFLPLSILKYVQVSAGFEGMMGMISSALGMMPVWNPVYKLTPS